MQFCFIQHIYASAKHQGPFQFEESEFSTFQHFVGTLLSFIQTDEQTDSFTVSKQHTFEDMSMALSVNIIQ